jgi:hypothetical protein
MALVAFVVLRGVAAVLWALQKLAPIQLHSFNSKLRLMER